MSDFEHLAAHQTGDCAIDCPNCAIEELDRLAAMQKRDSIADPEAYFMAPDQAGRPALWRITDNLDEPQLVTRRADWADPAAWELLELGVRLSLAVAAE